MNSELGIFPSPLFPLFSHALQASSLSLVLLHGLLVDLLVRTPVPLVTSLHSSQDDSSYKADPVTFSLLNVC